jgi:hypothetical protein
LYKGTVYISEFKNLFEAFVDILSTSDGLYNYTVSYINTGYISLLNVDIYFVGEEIV